DSVAEEREEAPVTAAAELPETQETAGAEDLSELPLEASDEAGEDELLLGDMDMVAEDEQAPPAGARTWLSRDEEPEPAPAAKSAREGGTLFERMSNIARGAAKAQVDEDAPQSTPRLRTARDPLDIPRFLNRQNNQ
ncbi:MAG: cell division protein FtsZ, partial [Sphingomonadales bacterium]|nr:cell division protein FtsZ [Sphingomonadales bacterium]